MAVLLVGIAGVNGVLRVHVVPGRSPLLLSKEFLKDLCCHVDLGRGHLLFEKLGVRAVVTGTLTSFGQQGHEVQAEIQPHVRSGECAIYRFICGSSKQGKRHMWIASTRTTGHQRPTTSTLNPLTARMDKGKTPVTKRESTGNTGRDDG